MPLRLAIVALALLVAGDALADDKEACVQAVEHAQVVRLDGKLREAREGFVTCARAVCPDAIRRDCTRWVTEVEASLPSVVFDAVWADGPDATGMRVLLDGKPLAGTEPGRAVPLDPGEHGFRFEVAGAAPIEQRYVIREGEKNRILRVTFTPLSPGPDAPAAPPAPVASPATVPGPANLFQPVPAAEDHPAPGPPPARGPVPLAAYILGSAAVVSFAGFAVLGLNGTSRLDSMRSSCAPTCNPSDVTSARNEILVGDIVGTVGLVAAGAALWLVLTRPYAAPMTSVR
jgi:hypothetical protein